MSAEAFLDTNIFVYCFDPSSPDKQQIALELIDSAFRDGTTTISTQVIQEFLNVATRKFADEFSREDLRSYLKEVLTPLCSVYPDPDLYDAALEIQMESGFHFYDALIVAAAIRAECKRLYTEDMQHGRTIRGLTIENPFRDG